MLSLCELRLISLILDFYGFFPIWICWLVQNRVESAVIRVVLAEFAGAKFALVKFMNLIIGLFGKALNLMFF